MKINCTYFLCRINGHKGCKFIFTLLLFLFLKEVVVCSQSVSSITYDTKITKTIYPSESGRSLKTYIISGKVTQTSSYCGGARPPEEMLKRLATPVVFPGKKFYIRKGKINNTKAKIVKSFVTDSTGSFSIRLAPGTYSIILEEQVHKIRSGDYTKKYQVVDNRCLQEWWAKPYYLVEVKDENVSELTFNFHNRCYITSDIPCITYKGPLHP